MQDSMDINYTRMGGALFTSIAILPFITASVRFCMQTGTGDYGVCDFYINTPIGPNVFLCLNYLFRLC